MKQIISKLKIIGYMLIWDFITAIVLFGFMYFVLSQLDTFSSQLIVTIATVVFVVLMLAIKYQLLYTQYGRDDVTGGKNKKEFERIAKDLLRSDGQYVLVYANIDRFKLINENYGCLLYTSPSPRDPKTSRMPSSA